MTEGITSDNLASHTYIKGTGSPCIRGYSTFVITITASGNITRFYARDSITLKNSNNYGYLECIINIPTLTTCVGMFYLPNGSISQLESCIFECNTDSVASFYSAFSGIPSFSNLVIKSSNTCTTMAYMCDTTGLKFIDLPALDSITDFTRAFYRCKLETFTVISMAGATSIFNMFRDNNNLEEVILPNMNSLINMDGAFDGCNNIVSITFGNMNNLESAIGTFKNNFSLKSIINFNSAKIVDSTDIATQSEVLTIFNASNVKFSSLGIYGSSGKLNKTTIITFSASSTFSSGLNISYCDMSEAQLNTIFTALPLVAATINITGCTGAATCDKTIAQNKGWTVTG